MWVKQPSGAEKRKRRNGRFTNSELNRAAIRASAKPKSKPTARLKSKPTGAEGTEQQGSSALEKSDATSSGVKPARSEEKESEVILPAAGSKPVCPTSQSKAFEKDSETATGQLHLLLSFFARSLDGGPMTLRFEPFCEMKISARDLSRAHSSEKKPTFPC